MTKEKQTKKSNSKLMLRAGKILLATGICLMFTVSASAQSDLTDPDAPIDGGVSLLVAAGVAYGAKQWRNARKNKQEANNASND